MAQSTKVRRSWTALPPWEPEVDSRRGGGAGQAGGQGSDPTLGPRSGVGRGVSLKREIMLTWACLLFTALMILPFAWLWGQSLVASWGQYSTRLFLEQSVFGVTVAFLLYGNVVYQLARLGHLGRRQLFVPAAPAELDRIYETEPTSLAVLVPSYREDPRLVRMTLLSAALQEHPQRRVVLLIDDPPYSSRPGDHEALLAARRLPRELQALLDEPASRFRTTLDDFRLRETKELDLVAETLLLASLFDEAAAWFATQAAAASTNDHVERFFVREVLQTRVAQHHAAASALRQRAVRRPLTPQAAARAHRRLTCLFAVDLTSFERKSYDNLSHAPNKAMNLNSYIGLLGKRYRTVTTPDRVVLEVDADGDLSVPAADYLITLDADSLLLPHYALRLSHLMRQPGNERVAVAQSPYSAFPEAPGVLERVAGATTDIMHLVHQGTSRYHAAYWVGANALLRTAALRDIAEEDVERGYPITRFIQDRTVIEDTESSIDLIRRGWRVENYPARLAYSATPPDYGSLLIQRRRWANGGLLILPKLVRYALAGPGRVRRLPEVAMRLHYLTSITGVNVALLVLLAYPFQSVHVSVWLPLSAMPYFVLYTRDLVQAGYRYGDMVRVYALNLLLVPVNLGGVLKSLQQACTGRHTPFGRTPKVASRTPAPALYVVVTVALLAYWTLGATVDLAEDRIARAVFAVVNVGLLAYAVTRFMGWRAAFDDARRRLTWLPFRGRNDPAQVLPAQGPVSGVGPTEREPPVLVSQD